jgi:transcriptional regulator of acetoin/glycerol metabolism
MAYRTSKLGLLVRLQPSLAADEILAAYRRHGGQAKRAAEHLGVDRSTLNRWIGALELRPRIEQIRADQAATAELDSM